MRIPLTGRLGALLIVVGSALLIYSTHWLSPHPHVALDMPISLSSGRITTGYFNIDPDTLYYVDVELSETPIPKAGGCEPHSVLRTQFTLTNTGQPPTQGSSPWEDSGLTLAVLLSEGPSLAFDATVLPGASCLNARNPRLKVRTHVHPSDLYSGLNWLSVWSLAIGFVLVARLWRWEVIPERPVLTIVPGMVVRNVLPFQRHRTMPLLNDLPHFGLLLSCIILIPVFCFTIFGRRPHLGLVVKFRGQNTVTRQRSPWSETLSVYVDGQRGFYVNGQAVPREELRAKLSEELERRVNWDVYFEADEGCLYADAIYSIDTIQGLGANLIWITPRVRKELEEKAAGIRVHIPG